MDYKDMDRKELMAAAKEAGIKGYATMKTEAIIEALENVGEVEPTEEVNLVESKTDKHEENRKAALKPLSLKDLPEAKRLQYIEKDMNRKIPVVITDLQRSRLTEDGENPLELFSVQSGPIEVNQWVDMNSNDVQYIKQGILRIMEEAQMDATKQVAGKMTEDSIKFDMKKRFIIHYVEGMSPEEIKEQIAREQARAKKED